MSEHSSLFIEDLHNCYYVRPRQFSCIVEQNWSFMDHLSGALPTRNIFNLLDEIRSGSRKFCLESLIRPYERQYTANMMYNNLSGLRSVFGNPTDSLTPLRLIIRFVLGTWF